MPHLSLKLLGQFQALLDGALITGFSSDKTRALLAYLALESDRPHRRESLTGLLWPDVSEAAARQSLSQALSNLRKLLHEGDSPQPFLLADRDTVRFNPKSDFTLDVNALTPACDDLAGAYRGALLEGFTLPDADGFEEWLLLRRESVQRAALEAFDGFIAARMAQGQFAPAIEAGRRQIEIDPWREETHRQLMRAYALNGQRSDAIAQHETCRKVLADALGVKPSPETETLLAEIKAGALQPAPKIQPAQQPAKAEPAQHIVNLPQSLTPFIGRERELDDLQRMLADPHARLITLTGLGGMGKTRLAIQAGQWAATNAHLFSHGVVFVSLAPVSHVEQATPALASALKFNLSNQGDPHNQLLDYLRDKAVLIVLDNLEHLLAGQADLVEARITALIEGAPRLKILATSREALGMAGEWLYAVDGLSDDALALFTQSARRVQAGYHLAAADEPIARRICQLVDHMPLGIELAASWVPVLTLQEIADEISRGMDVLTAAKRTGKHRSMTAVLDQSWQLLSEDEQQAMQQLSVFRGSFTREMARQVAGIALTTLAQLVSKSMLRRAEGNRYDLHELMRQYAGAQLQKHGDEQAARRKHALAYAALIENAEPAFYGPTANQRVSELEPERANFRAALEWSAGANGDAVILMRLAAALMRYTYMLPDWHDGDHWLREALKRKDEAKDDLLTARVQLGLGMMEHAWCNFDTALGHLEPALATFEKHNQTWHVAWTLSQMMECHFGAGRVEPCEALAPRSLALFRQLNDAWGTAYVTWQTGHNAMYKGEFEHASALATESFIMFEQLGDPICPVLASNLLATIAVHQRDYSKASEHFQWGVQRCSSLGHNAGVAWGTQELGEVALMKGDSAEARLRFTEAIPLRYDIGDLVAVYECIQGLGIAAAQQGDAAGAARWFGMAAQDKRGAGLLMKTWLRQWHEEGMASARAALSEADWQAAWDAGHAASLPAMVAEMRAGRVA